MHCILWAAMCCGSRPPRAHATACPGSCSDLWTAAWSCPHLPWNVAGSSDGCGSSSSAGAGGGGGGPAGAAASASSRSRRLTRGSELAGAPPPPADAPPEGPSSTWLFVLSSRSPPPFWSRSPASAVAACSSAAPSTSSSCSVWCAMSLSRKVEAGALRMTERVLNSSKILSRSSALCSSAKADTTGIVGHTTRCAASAECCSSL
mmetsp:Transcript_5429/g.13231  ORF Transcript_5429/g.13231 Transcript_5429/m.13231 type:complete len:205 (-) Transcript_5429:1146-1760(-)